MAAHAAGAKGAKRNLYHYEFNWTLRFLIYREKVDKRAYGRSRGRRQGRQNDNSIKIRISYETILF